MTAGPAPKDLIVLTADKSLKLVILELLARYAALGCRPISVDPVDVPVHPRCDPGVQRESQEFLRPFMRKYVHALAVCDREGGGRESLTREQIEARIENSLKVNGWDDRAAAIVINPELENWMWGDWPITAASISWRSQQSSLRSWLIEQQLLVEVQGKPPDPKKALERAARYSGKRWSSSIHAEIASRARVDGCVDEAFLKLRSVLQKWFPK